MFIRSHLRISHHQAPSPTVKPPYNQEGVVSDMPPYQLAALRRGVGRSDMPLLGGLALPGPFGGGAARRQGV